MDVKLVCLLCFIVVINYIFVGNGNKVQDDLTSKEKDEKLEHKKVGANRKIANKRIQADQVMGSIQLGIQHSVEGLACKLKHNFLKSEFFTAKTTVFPRDGSNHTPPHCFPEFIFKSYAPNIFNCFRKLYGIQSADYKTSFSSSSLRKLSNPSASGSIFYITHDHKFIVKSVQERESRFLQELLPGYYLNLNQNPSTLLPKFFGFYRYQRNSKNFWTRSIVGQNEEKFTLVAMNNLLPSDIEIHQKYDLKGSTRHRKASEKELQKPLPTYRDLDFTEHHPKGIFLEPKAYLKLMKTLKRDCEFLEKNKIMDYSLLMGVYYVDRVQEKKTNQDKTRSSKAVKKNTLPTKGLHALSGRDERLLLFVGIIDVLQRYGFKKKIEHAYKSIIYDGDKISVHRPDFYATRFLDFMTKSVFKKLSGPLKRSWRKLGMRELGFKKKLKNN